MLIQKDNLFFGWIGVEQIYATGKIRLSRRGLFAIGICGGFNHNCQLPEKNKLTTGKDIVSPGFRQMHKQEDDFVTLN